jgi:TetR/AcrR family transcriptional regulator, ethionamide resistance regulator
MNERVLHATFAGDTPAVDEPRLIEALVAVWLGAIYGTGASPTGG